MQAVDDIMALPQASVEEYRAAVEEQCSAVIVACSFQDLTGQRINKIVEMLLRLEGKVATLHDLLGDGKDELQDEPEDELGGQDLLNGPAAPGEGIDQSAIDALFA